MAERPDASYDAEQGGVRFRVHRGAQVVALSVRPSYGPELTPTPSATGFVSGALLAHKAKQIDDGVFAAVEIAAQEGAGTTRGKRFLLERVVERLEGDGVARATLEAAASLGGAARPPSAAAKAIADAHLADPLASKPIGFYTWTEGLARVFRQDRLLQRDLSGASDLPRVVAALAGDAEARAIYERTLRLAERLTNPLARPDLRALVAARLEGRDEAAPPGTAFLPPSRAHETELVKRLFGASPIPDGFDLARELAVRVRDGRIDLTPREDSGAYDVQTWAIETLAAPRRALESARLALDPSYQAHLEELFRAILAATRETHVKQLEFPAAGCAPPREVDLVVAPRLTVEPLPTFYERRADAYRFVRALLKETFGEEGLVEMRGVRASGRARESLADELAHAIRLFDGAAAVALAELGIPSTRDGAAFEAWARSADPDLALDARTMVPVFYDVERKKTKVWIIVGWTEELLDASFAAHPRVELFGGARANVRFGSASYRLASPVMIEAYVSRLLDRDELRALCDRERSVAAIASRLA